MIHKWSFLLSQLIIVFVVVAMAMSIFAIEIYGSKMNNFIAGDKVQEAKDDEYALVTKGKSFDSVRTVIRRGLYGYVDEEGHEIVPPAYSWAKDFVNGVGVVSDNGRIMTFNAKGEQLQSLKENVAVSYFDGNFGIAYIPNKDPLATTSRRLALFDGTGNMLTDYEYDTILPPSNISCYGVVYAVKNGKTGALNPDGSVLIPFEFDTLQTEGSNNSAICAMKWHEKSNKAQVGYYLTNGMKLIDVIYDDGAPFENGYGRLKKNGKWAVVDMYGAFVTGFDFYGVDAFREGIAIVKGDDNPNPVDSVFGAIDTKGNLVIPYDYHSINVENGKVSLTWNDNTNVPYRVIDNPVMQAYEVKVNVNGNLIYMDQEPVIRDGRTLVPVRAIAETLGFDVDWFASEKAAVFQNNKIIVRMKMGAHNASFNIFDDGIPPESIQLDVPIQAVNGRIMVPIRFIAESFGADVAWDESTRTVIIALH